MDDPRAEAVSIFDEIIQNLTSASRDIRLALRKGFLAYQLLGKSEQSEWFRRELEGYPQGIARPSYRVIAGTAQWVAAGNPVTNLLWCTSNEAYSSDLSSEPTTLDVPAPIDWILEAAQTGFTEFLGEEKVVYSRSSGGNVSLKHQKYFTPAAFKAIIWNVEELVYNSAVSSYAQLKYGHLMTGIWEEYRQKVEDALQVMGLPTDLSAIQHDLESGNTAALRMAVLGCRNLLRDIADYLWRDQRSTYDLLSGSGNQGKLEVTSEKYKNRLRAYLHQKKITGKSGKFMSASLDYLAAQISSLIALQGKGHDSVDADQARSIALATYIAIGELAVRTDLDPVTEWQDPSLIKG